jgi:gluconokinase
MSKGIPLTDTDRWPWLEAIGTEIAATATGGRNVVAACSALKRSYRDFLRSIVGDDLVIVMLHGQKDLIASRLARRVGHFMPASLLDSQFEALEWPDPDENPILADIAQEPRILIAELISEIVGRAAPDSRPHGQDGISSPSVAGQTR